MPGHPLGGGAAGISSCVSPKKRPAEFLWFLGTVSVSLNSVVAERIERTRFGLPKFQVPKMGVIRLFWGGGFSLKPYPYCLYRFFVPPF